ncbi:MAG TPA: serine/threonine-protein kinase [Kofleriaceae bacterium]|nr:serine/threonine-protein kinase [Kofleriaceae bacterium]
MNRAPTPLPIPLPTSIGRYRIVQHLATGGMAELLLGHDGKRYVAIKRIRGESARDAQFVKMFLEEANLAASLRHEHIVDVLEIGQDDDEYFFAMEYVHGEDLRKVLLEVNRRDDLVPIMEVIAIACAAAAGLHHAHEKRGPNRELLGIVHRDVSPANILVGYDGTVKVADFGIAKAALRQMETRSGTLKGKVSYMSPEQISGKQLDRRSDVFALGIVLYELTTARRLYKGDNDFLVMTAIVQGEIPRPSLLRPELPRALEDIIMKALATNPGARYQTADELRCALEDYASSVGMRHSPKSIADYMKTLFGQRQEPWKDTTRTDITRPFEFDGSASGVISAPASPARLKVAPSSPIAMMQEIAPPSGTQMAWIRPQTQSNNRRSIVIGVAAALTVAVGAGAMMMMKSSPHVQAATESSPAAQTAAPSPPPTPTPETSPPVAAPPPVATPPADDPEAAARLAAEKAEAAKRAAAEAKQAEKEAKRLAAEQAAADKAAKIAADKEAKRVAAEQAAAMKAEKAAAAREAKRAAAERASHEKKTASKPAEKKWDTKSLFPE